MEIENSEDDQTDLPCFPLVVTNSEAALRLLSIT